MPLSSRANINIGQDNLRADDYPFQREWLVTNQIGGYASATLATANTRRYHGLLVAALQAPVGRAVLLSKLEETLEIVAQDGSSSPAFPLSANLYPSVTYPQGHHALESWSAYPAPTWTWSPMPGVRIEKRIWMAPGANTTYVAYRLVNAPAGATARLHVVPLIAWKNYHTEMHANEQNVEAFWFSPAPMAVDVGSPRSTLRITLPPIPQVTQADTALSILALHLSGEPAQDAVFTHQPYWYYRFQHPREQERGLDFEEDLLALGMFTLSVTADQPVVFAATVEPGIPPSPQSALNALVARQNKLTFGHRSSFQQRLALAAGQFVVAAPRIRSTIIAGFPWFSDWGRDTMISLPGIMSVGNQKRLAHDVLTAYAGFVSDGMVPNRFPDEGQAPEYNTADATLWFVAAVHAYVRMWKDAGILKQGLWNTLLQIVSCHQHGTRFGIYVASDCLLHAGQSGTQLTWMDAKVADLVVTPRIGKPVELNALWYNVLKIMEEFAALLGEQKQAREYSKLADKCGSMFVSRFARPDGQGLYDVLDTPGGAPDESIRPNQIFSLSMAHSPVKPGSPLAESILNTVKESLYTPVGLRTLSPDDPAYRPTYQGDPLSRDTAYHQGTAWPWLIGPFAIATYRVTGDRSAALAVLARLEDELTTLGMGSLAEVYDGGGPGLQQRPGGCIAQAWSVAETLWALREIQGSE